MASTHWLRLFGRTAAAEDPRSTVTGAIAKVARERERLRATAGQSFVSQAQVDRAVAEQRLMLVRTRAEIESATIAASEAAAAARHDGGDAAAAPFDRTVTGFRSQLDVVDSSIQQVDDLHHDVARNSDAAQRLLRENVARLDESLRVEVRLLLQLERLERARLIAKARRGRGGRPAEQ